MTPSAGIIDSQSVKITTQGGFRGFDGAKKVNGRKRHVLVDTQGLVMKAVVSPADVQDTDGAEILFERIQGHCRRLKHIWVDAVSGCPKMLNRPLFRPGFISCHAVGSWSEPLPGWAYPGD